MEYIEGKNIIEKADLDRIDVSLLPKKLPEFRHSNMTKDLLISKWLEKWIETDLKSGIIKENQLLPKKADIAAYLGISVGTVQNAIRYIEDNGYVESKQRIGTLVKDVKKGISILRKQTSKREQAILSIQKFIIKEDYKINDILPSSRDLSKRIGSATNTTRLALEYLACTGVIKSMGNRGNKANWILISIPKVAKSDLKDTSIQTVTLVQQVENDLKNYIEKNYSVGNKLPAHMELSAALKVSIKTIHDAMKELIRQGILSAKRGRYGTKIIRMPNEKIVQKPENSIFASAQEASFYNYEKIEKHIKNMIVSEYKIGQKLPSMHELAKKLDVSGNTIRKALQNLAKECIVEFSRGKYGGTFIVNMPKNVEKQSAFTWLSVNPEHAKAYRGQGKETAVK
ncbi:MAG: GntR family transcriptional regulator [Eubacteriales bacterium]|nr:GntR family transcriptional regulator [Eubacteriales bacterium]